MHMQMFCKMHSGTFMPINVVVKRYADLYKKKQIMKYENITHESIKICPRMNNYLVTLFNVMSTYSILVNAEYFRKGAIDLTIFLQGFRYVYQWLE